MEFYQIENPTTQQIFNAIVNGEYVPLENIQYKCKQVLVLLKDHFASEEIFITFSNVTNSGGYPIFFDSTCSMYEVAAEQNEDFYSWSEEEQNNEIELLSSYLQEYESIFNL